MADLDVTTDETPVVLVNHTVMDGQVVRWYWSQRAAHYGSEVLSASRHGVLVGRSVFLHEIPAEWLAAANEAYGQLRRGRDVAHLATHRRGLKDELEPVEQGEVDRG